MSKCQQLISIYLHVHNSVLSGNIYTARVTHNQNEQVLKVLSTWTTYLKQWLETVFSFQGNVHKITEIIYPPTI